MKTNLKLLLACLLLLFSYYLFDQRISEKNSYSEREIDSSSNSVKSTDEKSKTLNIRRINTTLINSQNTDSDRDDALKEFLIAKGIFDGTRPIDISEIKTLTFEELTNTELITVSYLPNLIELNITGTLVNNIDCLANLTELKHLNIAETQVENIEALKELRLKTLIMSDTKVSNFQVIGKIKSLELLDLSRTDIKNINNLKNLENLVHLNISNTKISDLSPVLSLSNIKKLNYSNSGVVINSDNIELILRTR